MLRIAILPIIGIFGTTFALAEDGPGIDPKAIEIVTTSSEFLAGQPQISLSWFMTFDEVVEGREKRTTIWTGNSQIVRGQGYRSSSVRGGDAYDYLFNGETFAAVYGRDAQYWQIEAPGSFQTLNETLTQSYEVNLPMAEIFDQSGSAEGFAAATEAVYVDEVFFGDVTAHHLAFRRYEGDWEMWISTDPARPVPLMIAGSNPYAHGWPSFQALLYDWDFTADVPEGAFTFEAPAEFEEIDPLVADETDQ